VYPLMGTISETAKRAAEENIGISKTHIRRMVLNGEIPTVRSGSKYLINWNLFIEYLNNPQQPTQIKNSVIRPIPEKRTKNSIRPVLEKRCLNE